MRKIFTLTSVWLMFFGTSVYGQRTISGNVTDKSGAAIPGVAVEVKNTTIGTVSDIEGNYSLPVVENDAVLVFSFLGYKDTEVDVGSRSVIDVVLIEDVQSLDEVIVIAYGETQRRKFTGSLSTVNASEISNIPQTSPLQMVQGRAAGVLVEDNGGAPGSVGSILIRGVGSYNSNTEPLYVIDGIPTANFQAFNPGDIESISILKDASATSIYGSRASNGVVLITTKQGKAGKSRLGFNAQIGFADLENPNDFGVMDASQYTDYYTEAYTNAGLDPNVQLPASSEDTDWLDEVLQTGKTQLYELNLSGGNEKMAHYISASYFNQEGIIIGTDYERYTGRVNLSFSPLDRVGFDVNVLGSYANNALQYSDAGRGGTFAGAFNVSPLSGIYATDDTPLSLNGQGYNFDLPSNAGHNPVATEAMNSRTRDIYRAFPTFRINIEPIDHLTITSSASVDLSVYKENSFQSKYYYAENDNGLAEAETAYSINSNLNALVKYEFNINNDHTITPLIGVERFKRSYESEGAESREFGFDGIPLVGEGSVMLDINSDYSANTLVSFFSRINYSFKDKLFIDGSFRRDGSSRFGPENLYGSFYSMGLGYDLSRETFMESQNIFSQLRVRGSYGVQGNDNIGDYSWRKTYNSTGTFIVPGGSNAGAQPEDPGNESIQWEESVSFNVGLDFGILNNALTGTVEYYSRGSDELLGNRQISRTSGFESFADNLGDIRNKGVEINLTAANIKIGDVSWTSNLNLTFNNNEIKKLNAEGDTLINGTRISVVGEPYAQWYLPQYGGVDPGTGRPLYRTETGELSFNSSEAFITVSGQSALNPDLYGGFTNTFTYKGFTLSGLFYFKYGFKIYNDLRQQLSVPGTNNIAVTNLGRWQNPGDVTTVPIADFNDPASAQFESTRWLEDGSFIRLRNVSLAYTIPASITNKWRMTDLTFSIKAVNLITFTDYSGYDPGAGSFDEDGTYPVNRTITFGLSAKF